MAATRTRKPFVQYRVVVKHGTEVVWREPSAVCTSNGYAAEYAAKMLNLFMRENGTQNIAVVQEEGR